MKNPTLIREMRPTSAGKFDVRCNSVKAWLLAARPKTLTGAAVPVMVALALAAYDLQGQALALVPAVLCVLFAFVMQIDANFVNDYFDAVRGNDDEERLGPERACAQGWVTLPAMRKAITITTAIGCLVGLPLIIYGGWTMVLLGVACVAFCFLYTTRLSYVGMGDVLVLVFFGLVPVMATYYLQTQTINFDIFFLALATGCCIDDLLIVNNYRDIEGDRKAGKRTLVVAVGARGGRRLYLLSGLLAQALLLWFTLEEHHMVFVLPALLYLPSHLMTWRKMVRLRRGRVLNRVLADTARNILIFGLSVAISVFLV